MKLRALGSSSLVRDLLPLHRLLIKERDMLGLNVG